MSTAARILLIKNGVNDATSIIDTLEYLGYHVDELLFSKENVIEKAKDFHPDIVLMDGDDGGEGECKVVQWMRNEVDVPVVQLISSVEKNSVDLMNMDDLSDYVLKPVNEMDLRYSIEIAWYKHELNKKIGMNGENFSKLINNVDELVFSINSEYKITNWNSSIEQMSGYASDDVNGMEVDRLGIFDQVDEIKRVVDDVCHGDAKVEDTQPISLISKKGDKKIIAVRPPRVVYDGHHCVSVVFIGRDITYQYERIECLKKGNGYILVNENDEGALLLLKSLAEMSYHCLVITRNNPSFIKKVLGPYPVQILFMKIDSGEKKDVLGIDELLSIIKKFCCKYKNAAVFLSRIEFILMTYSFDYLLKNVYEINEITNQSSSLFLLNVSNKSFFTDKQLCLLQSELVSLPSKTLKDVIPDLQIYDMFKFIQIESEGNNDISFNYLRKKLQSSYPTIRRSAKHLEDEGFIEIVKKGRRKIVSLSEKGKEIIGIYES